LIGISIHRIQEGKIIEGWDGYDALSLMHQLGVIA
jgi:predicted ester cyclase